LSAPLVEVAGLTKHYLDNASFLAKLIGVTRSVQAVTEVSLQLQRGETLGLVGESGCGKSTLARCLVALEPVTSGDILFDSRPVDSRSRQGLGWFRSRAQIVFQDPQSSLNRSQTIEAILARPLLVQRRAKGAAVRERQVELLQLVGLDAGFLHRYPHELSGGQRQRVGIARAIAVEPDFIVLDEPVSALDVSIQAQIVNLLLDLQRRLGLTYLFISHDLNVVRYLSDRIAVMYLGRIVEEGPAEVVYARPRHPYTQLLLEAVPPPDPALDHTTVLIKGEVPSPLSPPGGCPFHPRCPKADARCRAERPLLRPIAENVEVACHLYETTSDPVPAIEFASSNKD
jgi:peptide/nickel transport system ATP-binding protein